MLRRYQCGKPAILGIAAALGVAAVSSAGMNFGIAPNQLDGLTVLMNQNFAQSHGMDVVFNGMGQSSLFSGSQSDHITLKGFVGSSFNGTNNGSQFLGKFSNSLHTNGNGQGIGNGSFGDDDAGIQGIPLPMSALLGLGGLIGMGLIRRYTR